MVQGECMNIAFYVDAAIDNDQTRQIFKCLNDAITNAEVEDACLFFNNPTPNLNKTKFSFFNSTEVWNFTGLLVNTSLQGAIYSMNVVNKFKPVYLFSKTKDIMNLIYISSKMPIVVTSKEDEQEVYRLTGRKPKLVNLDAESLMGILDE